MAVESPEAFCRRIAARLFEDGFDVELRPGDHLVDDAGADSLAVMHYVLLLQELGLDLDLAAFDTELLDTGVAYRAWIRKGVAAICHAHANEAQPT
jgi:acyl carrier protein